MSQSRSDLETVIAYMKTHWPSQVKDEWQVAPEDYIEIIAQVLTDFREDATQNHQLFRIAGLSGSGKTTQILPAVEAYCKKNQLSPILLAARRFVKYHPHREEIEAFYGPENLRKLTDEFSTIMLFLAITFLTVEGYDIILDVTLLDPQIEAILLEMLENNQYEFYIFMIATSPKVTEYFLAGRAWRHSAETEKEFIRATKKALEFYAENSPETRIVIWSVYNKAPEYDGPVKNVITTFRDFSNREELPASDDDARRAAKVEYLTTEF